MARAVRVKNTGADKTWVGQLVASGTYYTLQDFEVGKWKAHEDVFADVGTSRLVINDGEKDFTDTTEGWAWLEGNLITTVEKEPGHLSGNDIVNWHIERTILPTVTYRERMVVPSGKTFVLDGLAAGSAVVPTAASLLWSEWSETRSKFITHNPDIRPAEYAIFTVDGNHSASDTTIEVTVTNGHVISNTLVDKFYNFYDPDVGDQIIKVTAINLITGVLTLEEGLFNDISDGSLVTLVDRPIASLTGQILGYTDNLASPPTFAGNGKSYLEISLTNADNILPGNLNAKIRGWLEPTVSGS